MNLLDVDSAEVSDWKMINLRLPNNRNSNEVIWLLSSYVREVWSSLFVKGAVKLNAAKFFGFFEIQIQE